MAHEPQLNCKLNKDHETLYDQIGGNDVCRALSQVFHDRVANDPVLKPLFPKNLDTATERLALFIAEQMGGPAAYSVKRGKTSLHCRHAHLAIGPAERETWLSHMFEAIDQVGIVDPTRERLRLYFTETAHFLSDNLLTLYQLPLDNLRSLLEQDPSLATTSDMGRTLLADAALRWDAPRVQLLLEHGADVNALDHLGHDPLYQATRPLASPKQANGCAVVELLLKHGSAVNRQSSPTNSTALHNAARRGHVAIAEILLNAGADIETKDSKGQTPLRRAVNCRQKAMVHLLLSRGAAPIGATLPFKLRDQSHDPR